MQILNRHHLQSWPPGATYIGRGTPLGNPYVIGEHGDRDAVCNQYEDWLAYKMTQRDPAILTALFGLHEHSNLVCSCAPARCHGEAITAAWLQLQQRMPTTRGYTMSYAGVGSRTTPSDVLERMTVAARRLARLGYTLRSGAAVGADSAFEQGAGVNKEVFLPWRGFNGSASSFVAPTREAGEVAAALHPSWGRLSPAVKKLMSRNSHQILGADLRSPVDFMVCWTPDGAECEAERSADTGGTGQAIALASRWSIPVFNLAKADAGERLRDYLREEQAHV